VTWDSRQNGAGQTNLFLPSTNVINFQSPPTANFNNGFSTPTGKEQASLRSPVFGCLPKINDFSRIASLVCQNPDAALNKNIAESMLSADKSLPVQPLDLSLQNWSQIINEPEVNLWNSPNPVRQNVRKFETSPEKEFQTLSNYNPAASNESLPFDLEEETNSSNYFSSSILEQGVFEYVAFTPDTSLDSSQNAFSSSHFQPEISPNREMFESSQNAFTATQFQPKQGAFTTTTTTHFQYKQESFDNSRATFKAMDFQPIKEQNKFTHSNLQTNEHKSSVTQKVHQKHDQKIAKQVRKGRPPKAQNVASALTADYKTDKIENPPTLTKKRNSNKNKAHKNNKVVLDEDSIPEKFFMGNYINHVHRPTPKRYKKIHIKENKITKGCTFCLDAYRVANLPKDEIIVVHERVRICFRNQSQKYGKPSSECPICIFIGQDLGNLVPSKSKVVHEEMTWCVQKWVLEMGQRKIFAIFPTPSQLSDIIDYSIKMAQEQIDEIDNQKRENDESGNLIYLV
jgi:hypothetical protein